jgi:hypothetical protein
VTPPRWNETASEQEERMTARPTEKKPTTRRDPVDEEFRRMERDVKTAGRRR